MDVQGGVDMLVDIRVWICDFLWSLLDSSGPFCSAQGCSSSWLTELAPSHLFLHACRVDIFAFKRLRETIIPTHEPLSPLLVTSPSQELGDLSRTPRDLYSCVLLWARARVPGGLFSEPLTL